MTIEQLIEKYQKKILVASDKRLATSEIIKEIDKLVYTNTNAPISIEDKKKILIGLKCTILSESHEIFAQDNKEYLELIEQTIKMLGGN